MVACFVVGPRIMATDVRQNCAVILQKLLYLLPLIQEGERGLTSSLACRKKKERNDNTYLTSKYCLDVRLT